MTTLLLKQGRIIDPANQFDAVGDLLIRDGRVAQVGGTVTETVDQTLDCTGQVVCPGFIELHAGIRDPGNEEDETTATATAAAAAGGFTSITALPDTHPVVDTRSGVEYVILQSERARRCRVLPMGAVTRDNLGAELADLGQMADGGAVAFSDGKRPIQSAEILLRALEYARMFRRPIFTHPQDAALCAGGVMHEGYFSTRLGLRGMPAAAEEIMVSRNIALAELTRGQVHVMCVSASNSVDSIRRAKQNLAGVTADVAVHHLLLTDESLQTYDANYKVDPPLRSQEHRDSLIQGLQDGTIDAISSDHQPYAVEKKDREIDQVPFGIVGLETLLPLSLLALVEPGHLSLAQLIALLTCGPARVLGLTDRGHLSPDALADVTVFDPQRAWTIDPAQFRSMSRNTPFAGWEVRGKVTHVLVGGNLCYSAD